jgi:hypothetical protein
MTAKHSNDESDVYQCPCCGARTIAHLGDYEICLVCNWEDDPVQAASPDYEGGANGLSLNQARNEWRKNKVEKSKE